MHALLPVALVALGLAVTACGPVLRANANQRFTPPAVGKTHALPGSPDRDITYVLPVRGEGVTPSLGFDGERPLEGTMSFTLPETTELALVQPGPGGPGDFIVSQVYADGTRPQQQVFRSGRIGAEDARAAKIKVSVRFPRRPSGDLVRARRAIQTPLRTQLGATEVTVRGGRADERFAAGRVGVPLMRATMTDDGTQCFRIDLDAQAGIDTVLSAPVETPVAFSVTYAIGTITVAVEGARVVQLDENAPPDAWKTECQGEPEPESRKVSVTASLPTAGGQPRFISDRLFGGLRPGWLGVTVTAAHNLVSAQFDPAEETLTPDDFEFTRAPVLFAFDGIEATAGPDTAP